MGLLEQLGIQWELSCKQSPCARPVAVPGTQLDQADPAARDFVASRRPRSVGWLEGHGLLTSRADGRLGSALLQVCPGAGSSLSARGTRKRGSERSPVTAWRAGYGLADGVSQSSRSSCD